MDPPNKLPQRKPSILGMHNKYRSAHRTPPDSIYPSTSTSSQPYNSQPQRRRLGLRSFFSKPHEPEAQSPVLTSPSSSSAMPPSLPLIPKFTKAFVNALNSSQLCDFLTWLLYHDIVELPEVPEAWYKWISNMENTHSRAIGTCQMRSQYITTKHLICAVNVQGSEVNRTLTDSRNRKV